MSTSARFFRMPFCADRQVRELRCVFRLKVGEELRYVSPEVLTILQKYVDKNEIEDYQLFCAATLMRLDVGNYIHLEKLDSTHDINLYTINRNDENDQRKYFGDWRRGSIVSYFTHGLYPEEEVLYPERVLDFSAHSVIDSRPFIAWRVAGLYLIIDKRMDVYSDEFLVSEASQIKVSANYISRSVGMYKYEQIKREAAAQMGMTYAKEFDNFSLAGRFVSPSGHVMRIAFQESKGDASLYMLLEKFVLNYYLSSYSRLKRAFEKSMYRLNADTGEKTHWKFNFKKRTIEKSGKTLWHGKNDVVAGLKAAGVLCGKNYESYITKIASIMRDSKNGEEVERFVASRPHHTT